MEGKLIKQEDGYYALYNTEGIFISDVNGGSLANRLSLKNCQEIENGYDLMKLAEEDSHKYYDVKTTDWHCNYNGFFSGFQKAVEILGDKKFSEFLDKEKELGISDIKTIERIQWYYNTYFDKSQQTEWDVVVEMDIDNPCPKCGEKDNVHGNYDYSNITRPLINTLCNECGTYFSPIPKLDADGCIVLKRK